jgi:hypothetical protein
VQARFRKGGNREHNEERGEDFAHGASVAAASVGQSPIRDHALAFDHTVPMPKKLRWKDEPDEHDYPAAGDYLSLVLPAKTAATAVKRLRSAPIIHRKAKDLLRASDLPVLPADNVHVAKDLAKIRKAVKLSPVLLVRGDARTGRPLLIADGYHRICASYHVREDDDIPCRVVDLRDSD